MAGITTRQATARTAREEVERLVREDPRQTANALARQVGVSRQRVHQILKSSGYELVLLWRKRRPVKDD